MTLASLANAEGQLPFLYLNQYFSYEVLSASEINIADKTFDFKKFVISSEGKNIVFNLEAINQWVQPGSKLIFKSTQDKSLGQKTILKDKLIYRILRPESVVTVCLVSSSVFTDIQFCKAISATETSEIDPQVSVNGEPVDKVGTVVLKEKEESLVFSAILSTNSKLLLKTKKRNVLPYTIRKAPEDNFFNIQFIDESISMNNTWEEKVNLDQSYIVLRLDPIISMQQDLYFNKPNLKGNAWNYSSLQFIKNELARAISDDGLNTELFGIYSGLRGESPTLKASLNSDLGKGVRGTYKWPINIKTRGFFQGYVYQTSIISDVNNGVINPLQYPFAFAGGAEYQLWNHWSVLGQAHVLKDLFFKSGSGASVEIFTGLNTEISVTPIWEIYRKKDFKWTADLGLSYLYSTEIAAAGYKYQIGTSYVQKINLGQFALTSYYSNRSQNSSANTLTEQVFYYGAGYQYSF